MSRQLSGELGRVQAASLRHHGDREVEDGLLDFAVNVRSDHPPAWLRDRLTGALDRLAAYPSPGLDRAARTAVARRHGRDVNEVLALNGAAEAFALLPTLRPRLAAVVHPSFTEPEVALTEAGVPVRRVPLRAEDGYTLRPELVPEAADMVVLGNPTNPTSVLHPAIAVRALAREGRVLVVDEAFADTVPGEPESLAGSHVEGLLVLRSLTKTFALAGLRAGYAVAAPELLARLDRSRPQWPVDTLTLEAIRACNEPAAVHEAEAEAVLLAEHREWLAHQLSQLPGVRVYRPASAPFLLLHVPDGAAVRMSLRECGIAVRRADTFPGLSSGHLRVAVRSPERSAMLVTAMREVLECRSSAV